MSNQSTDQTKKEHLTNTFAEFLLTMPKQDNETHTTDGEDSSLFEPSKLSLREVEFTDTH